MDNIKKSGKYGLVFLPKASKTPTGVDPAFELGKQKIEQQLAKRSNVFDNESSSEDDSSDDEGGSGHKAPKKKLPPVQTATGSVQQKQSMQVMKKALQEDASIYEYDEIYDGMQEKTRQQKEKEKAAVDKKPKYIDNLLKTAARRQREHEERVEREVQKEREKEGDEFKDKEEFVTSAYRKKMEELEKLKEEEARQDSIDALVDVTKQKDLSGFYRHLYRQTMDHEESDKSTEPNVRQEPEPGIVDDNQEPENLEPKEEKVDEDVDEAKKEDEKEKERSRHEAEKRSDRGRGDKSDRDKYKEKDKDNDDKRRKSRRSDDDDDDEKRRRRRRKEEEEDRRRRRRRDDDDHHRRRHRDDDGDRRHDSYHSRSSGSSRYHDRDRDRDREDRRYHPYRSSGRYFDDKSKNEDRDRRDRRRRSPSPRHTKHEKEDDRKKIVTEESSTKEKENKPTVPTDGKPTEKDVGEETKLPAKPKVSIWEKRTVGTTLEEARARYLERRGTLQVAIVTKD